MFAWINNKFIESEFAQISIHDRSFRFGDGVFETIYIYNRKLYLWKDHFARLEKSLEVLEIDYNLSSLLDTSLKLIEKNEIVNGFLRITITRGKGSRGYLPIIEKGPNIIIETLPEKENSESIELGVSNIRKIPLECLPAIKSCNGLNSTLTRMEAEKIGFQDLIQLSVDDFICETSSANIFWIKNKKFYTPSLELPVLPGIMRKKIIGDQQVKEGKFKLENILAADEVFLTNINYKIMPVTKILDKDYEINVALNLKQEIVKHLENI